MVDPVPDALTAAWDQAVAAWHEPVRHDAVIAVVAEHRCFAWAAAKYRERAGDPIADKQLDRVRKAATATMLASAASRPDSQQVPYRNTMLVLIVLMLAIGVGLVYALVHDPGTTTAAQH